MKIVIAANKSGGPSLGKPDDIYSTDKISTEELDEFLLGVQSASKGKGNLWDILRKVKPVKDGLTVSYKLSSKLPFDVILMRTSSKYVVVVSFDPDEKLSALYEVTVGHYGPSYRVEVDSAKAAGKAAVSSWNKLTTKVWNSTRKLNSVVENYFSALQWLLR